jgi:selenocysteine-specific elongation factor
VRPLDEDVARLAMSRSLPLRAGDRGILRDPGADRPLSGFVVLDADPPVLRRRGAAVERARSLRSAGGTPDVRTEVARRGAVRAADLVALGVPVEQSDGVRTVGDWLVDVEQWERWRTELVSVVEQHAGSNPLEPGLPAEQARQALQLPDIRLLAPLAEAAVLEQSGGRLHLPGAAPALGPGVAELARRLAEAPFDAPEQPDLAALGVGRREIAAAARTGTLLRLGDDVVLLPDAPALAMRVLADLPQPFTASAARQALGTTRRVTIPLLEHLDARGWTRRVDGSLREVVR